MCDEECCCCSSVILGPTFGVFALIGMLCMTAGYVNNMNKNAAMVPATCNAISYQIQPDSCYRGCCSVDSNNKCIGCYYTCYSGFVTASIQDITPGSTFKVYTNDQYSNVNAFLSVNYPSGKLFSCFYTYTGSAVAIALGLNDVQGPYIAGLVFLGLAAAVGLVWLVIAFPTLLSCCFGCCSDMCDRCTDPCRSCKRRRQIAKEHDDEQRVMDAKREADRKSKINQELQDIENSIVQPPSHSTQFSQNPDYVPSQQTMTEIVVDEYSPPQIDSNAPHASAPPLTESTKIVQ